MTNSIDFDHDKIKRLIEDYEFHYDGIDQSNSRMLFTSYQRLTGSEITYATGLFIDMGWEFIKITNSKFEQGMADQCVVNLKSKIKGGNTNVS